MREARRCRRECRGKREVWGPAEQRIQCYLVGEEQGFQTLSRWGLCLRDEPTLVPYFKITSLPHRSFMLALSPFILSSSLLRGILFTRSHLVPLVTNCEMAWGVVWQRNTAWPTDTEIYFYKVDKQVSKLNIQYDPNFIFKILLKKKYIYTHKYIDIYVNIYFILYLYKKVRRYLSSDMLEPAHAGSRELTLKFSEILQASCYI